MADDQRPDILVVEDDQLSRDMLSRLLMSRDWTVLSVPDGPSAMEAIETAPPALVLLDVRMPAMSGLEVLSWARMRYSQEQLPIIMVTAQGESKEIAAALEAGANDYVLKPVDAPVLLARVATCLRMQQDIERLVDAERHRVTLETLGNAASSLLPLLHEAKTVMVDAGPDAQSRLHESLDSAIELIERFERASRFRTVPYTEGIGALIDATLRDTDESD